MHVHNIVELPGKPYRATLATEVTSEPYEGQDIWVRITPSFAESDLQSRMNMEAADITIGRSISTTNATLLHLFIHELSAERASAMAEEAISWLLESLNAIESGDWSEI